MGCNCGKSNIPQNQANANVPKIQSGTNQLLMKQMAEQQQQQQTIQSIIQKSANPNKTLIKTYR